MILRHEPLPQTSRPGIACPDTFLVGARLQDPVAPGSPLPAIPASSTVELNFDSSGYRLHRAPANGTALWFNQGPTSLTLNFPDRYNLRRFITNCLFEVWQGFPHRQRLPSDQPRPPRTFALRLNLFDPKISRLNNDLVVRDQSALLTFQFPDEDEPKAFVHKLKFCGE